MEEPKPPAATTQTLPLQTPQAPPVPPKYKKRPLDNNVQIQDSSYFKIRLLLKDIRPHFLQVLRTSDFRNCSASHEILEKMKLLMELYKQMTAETNSVKKLKTAEHANSTAQKPQPDGVTAKPSQKKQQSEHIELPHTYIVGGSAFGWNFIAFPGSKPAYYGVTKEAFRSSQAKLGQ